MVVDDIDEESFLKRLIRQTVKDNDQRQHHYWWLGMLTNGKARIQTVDGTELIFTNFCS